MIEGGVPPSWRAAGRGRQTCAFLSPSPPFPPPGISRQALPFSPFLGRNRDGEGSPSRSLPRSAVTLGSPFSFSQPQLAHRSPSPPPHPRRTRAGLQSRSLAAQPAPPPPRRAHLGVGCASGSGERGQQEQGRQEPPRRSPASRGASRRACHGSPRPALARPGARASSCTPRSLARSLGRLLLSEAKRPATRLQMESPPGLGCASLGRCCCCCYGGSQLGCDRRSWPRCRRRSPSSLLRLQPLPGPSPPRLPRPARSARSDGTPRREGPQGAERSRRCGAAAASPGSSRFCRRRRGALSDVPRAAMERLRHRDGAASLPAAGRSRLDFGDPNWTARAWEEPSGGFARRPRVFLLAKAKGGSIDQP